MTSATPEQLAYREFVGSRIRLAREEQGWSQAELAEKLGLSEEEMGRVEQGRHRMDKEGFRRLHELFARGLDFFTDVLLLDGRERFSWRVEEGTPSAAVERLQDRAARWVGLLRWLYERAGRLDVVREGPALLLEPQADVKQAYALAGQLGFQLGLGPVPAECLVEKVEGELGVPVLFVDTDPDGDSPGGEGILSGTCHLRDLDVILVNRRQSTGERVFGLAHELFHVLTWDEEEPEPLRLDHILPRRERGGGPALGAKADHFAASLLLPSASLERILDPAHVGDANRLLRAAAKLRVEPRVLGWYASVLGWGGADPGNAPATAALEREERLPGPFSRDFAVLLQEAMHTKISAMRVCEGLDTSLEGLADLFYAYGLDPPHYV